MHRHITRRGLLQAAAGTSVLSGTGALSLVASQQPQEAVSQGGQPDQSYQGRSTVAIVKGDERRKLVHDALLAIDEQIMPVLKRKKSVILKPNNVSASSIPACTHGDALRGVLDYLAPRFKGPVVIAESSAGETGEAFENMRYADIVKEHRSQQVSLVDLNEEGLYKVFTILNYDLQPTPVRLAARYLDPDAYIINVPVPKTNSSTIATISVKNMVLGAPLHQAPKETAKWNDKRQYHAGIRQMYINMMTTAQKLRPFWGATVIDAFEGMEGNGPVSGQPVDHRIAVASTDYVAADRVMVEAMGINPDWMGHLIYSWKVGVGQYDLSKIDVQGETIASVRRPYATHKDVNRTLLWMGPMEDLPPKIG